jgi:uncharacterized membrane protein YvbJ
MLAAMSKRNPPETCPVCGEDVPPNALACPECGADHNSGWREDADSIDAAGESADDFDYDEFVENEFGNSPKPAGMKAVWWISGIVLLFAFVLFYVLAIR